MNTGKINFKYTPEQIEIVKKMGSNNRSEALAAQEALAAVITQPLLKVIQTAPVISNLFKTVTYDLGTVPALPLDVYFDVRNRNYLNVWTQAQAGATATNFVQGISEMFVNTFELDAAVSFNKSYVNAGRLDVVAASLERLAQEILIKKELNAANIMLGALAGARINGQAADTAVTNLQVIRSATAGVFQMDDFNTMMTKFERQLASWVGSTPVNEQNQLTDIIGSPEFFGFVRSIAYNPINSRNGATTTSGASSLSAPDDIRSEVFRSAGVPNIFGINLIKSFDFGIGRTYNTLFSNYAGSTAYLGTGGTGSAAFTPTTEQLVVGINANSWNLVKVEERGASGELTVMADDQYTTRSQKLGFWGMTRCGFVSLDGRQSIGMLF